ncbi:forkhead box protein P4 [Triticum aestivum]|uniref:forkhead box protein P4 n=1 Tax=Triticum aestivum TaxID=4565 RepID=UPI001D006310|nr:forkhead box protein P4-like [Triticum aestivum]
MRTSGQAWTRAPCRIGQLGLTPSPPMPSQIPQPIGRTGVKPSLLSVHSSVPLPSSPPLPPKSALSHGQVWPGLDSKSDSMDWNEEEDDRSSSDALYEVELAPGHRPELEFDRVHPQFLHTLPVGCGPRPPVPLRIAPDPEPSGRLPFPSDASKALAAVGARARGSRANAHGSPRRRRLDASDSGAATASEPGSSCQWACSSPVDPEEALLRKVMWRLLTTTDSDMR